MKRLLQIMLCAVLFPKLSALADGSAHINAPPVKAEIGEEQLVLLNISDNPGMMGFKLHFVYDAEKVKIIQAIKGTATNSGRFTDNIGLEEGSFDILWNSTENVYEDGSVAVLKIEPLDTDFIIDVSYSPADTFNENWDDVELVCSPVVTEGYEGVAVSEEAPESFPQTDSSPEITPTQTAEIISDVLEELPETKGRLDRKGKLFFAFSVYAACSLISENDDKKHYYMGIPEFESADYIKYKMEEYWSLDPYMFSFAVR